MEWRRSILLDVQNLELRNRISSLLSNYQLSTSSFNDRFFDLIITENVDYEYRKSFHTKTILIFNRLDKINNHLLFDDYISEKEIDTLLIYRVNKLINPELNKVVNNHKGILLHSIHKYLKYKNTVVFLTNTEYILMEYLLLENKYISTKEIALMMEKEGNKRYTNQAVIVLINRLKKKILKASGLKIIKSRYKIGYYLSI